MVFTYNDSTIKSVMIIWRGTLEFRPLLDKRNAKKHNLEGSDEDKRVQCGRVFIGDNRV